MLREQDIVARIGGDEFVIMAIETDEKAVLDITRSLQSALTIQQISASLGFDVRHPTHGIIHAWNHADRKMYVHKMAKKQAVDKNIEPDYYL